MGERSIRLQSLLEQVRAKDPNVFRSGGCYVFALKVHERLNCPLRAIWWLESVDRNLPAHVFAVRNGRGFDACGHSNDPEFKDRFLSATHKIEPIEPNDLQGRMARSIFAKENAETIEPEGESIAEMLARFADELIRKQPGSAEHLGPSWTNSNTQNRPFLAG